MNLHKQNPFQLDPIDLLDFASLTIEPLSQMDDPGQAYSTTMGGTVETLHLAHCGCCGCSESSVNEQVFSNAPAMPDPVSAVEGTIPLLSGGATEIKYFFGDTGFLTYYGDNFAGDPADWTGEADWSTAQKASVRTALDDIEEIIDVTFVEATSWTGLSDADFTLIQNNNSGSLGTAGTYYSSSKAWSDVRINHTISDRWVLGSENGGQGYETLVHEIGHALGLGHTHDTGFGSTILDGQTDPFDAGPYGLNDPINSIMAYRDGWAEVGTSEKAYGNRGNFGAWDVKALQNRYGERDGANDTNSKYKLPAADGAGAYFTTIWDTGGSNDLIWHSGPKGAFINLNDATLDYTDTSGGPVSYVYESLRLDSPGFLPAVPIVSGGYTIAAGVVIENATGGSGADELTGNEVSNRLIGNAGDDILFGLGGNDRLYGRAGEDTIDGGAGRDIIYFTTSSDGVIVDLELGLGSGGDAEGDSYIDVESVMGSAFDDEIIGGLGFNNLSGRDGDDFLNGGAGSDILYGGAGADTFKIGDGDGKERVRDFENGVDKFDVGEFYTPGEAVEAAFTFGSGWAINFGGGDVLIVEGSSLAEVSIDDFEFV